MTKQFVGSCVLAAGLSLVTVLAVTSLEAQVIWDGGDGSWNSANWNGGLTAEEVFGRTNGLEVGGSELSDIVNVESGNVTYDPNASGDFRFRSGGPDAAGGTLNLSGGASLSMNSASDVDGKWTQFDGAALNLDNATLRRTRSGSSDSGGALIFGSWRSYENQVIDVSLANGATLDNHGQVWFGAWDDNAPGLSVNMTIDNGNLDLQGGWDAGLGPNGADADLVFINGVVDADPITGGGVPKNERYSVNFTGPGSIRVSEAGILHAIQDEYGDYNNSDFDQVSYQDLWNRGILQAHGYSGRQGAKFDGFFAVQGQVVGGQVDGDEYVLTSNVTTPTPIAWDGGDGAWNSDNWNGGQSAVDVMGRHNGLEIGSGEIGFDVSLSGGNVTYDPNTHGDFRYRAGGTLNLSGGATLTLESSDAPDGSWTQFDGDALTIDNAVFRRTQSGDSQSGGAMILGSWRSYEDQSIEVNLTGGGGIDNHGQLWFGAWGDNAPGLEVTVTIDDGYLDLTGGDAYDLYTGEEPPVGPGNADLVLINGYENDQPKGEEYVINFVGPGSITVDKSGILNPVADGNEDDPASYGDTLTTLLSYEDLWDRGILRANDLSGLDGADFSEFFSTSGVLGEDDYMLVSLLAGGVDYDCNGDGILDVLDANCTPADQMDAFLEAAGLIRGDADGDGAVGFPDFVVVSNNYSAPGQYTDGDFDKDGTVQFGDFVILSNNYGQSSAAVAQAVPEPSSWGLLGIGVLLWGWRRRRHHG
jgi:hypothetical protein